MRNVLVAVLVVLGLAAGSVFAVVIDVGDEDFIYGHNYVGWGDPRPFWYDCYELSGGFFLDNRWYLNPGTSGYMVYKFQADPGYVISQIDLEVQTYLEAGSWLRVLYRTTDYSGVPNFSEWNDLGYFYAGYNTYWTTTVRPGRNVVYLAYQGQNTGTAGWQFQIQKDQLTLHVASSVSLVSTYLHPGDADGDEVVSFQDFAILQNNYGQSGKTWFEGDFNGDGRVTFEDFCILQNNFGYDGTGPGLYVDRYFQWKANDWPGKVKSDLDLRNRIAEEDQMLVSWGRPGDRDPYGGVTSLGWQETATGFFRVIQRQGYYWLISPEGNPCFYTGLCGVGGDTDRRWPPCPVTGRESFFNWLPPTGGEFYYAWMPNAWGTSGVNYILPITSNLIRKYGADWRSAKAQRTFDRLKAWGFSGAAKWCTENSAPLTVPWIPVLNRGGVPNLINHPDIFDSAVCATFDDVLRQQCESYRDDPWLLGLSFGNEDGEMIFTAEIRSVMALGSVPAKRALVDYAYATIYGSSLMRMRLAWKAYGATSLSYFYSATNLQIPSADLETLRRYYVDRYYSFVYTSVKQHDPNHLFFGFWTPGWRCEWVNPDGSNSSDWLTAARYCDVLGYDHYDQMFARTEMQSLLNAAGKPVFVGEFGWSPDYGGQRGFAAASAVTVSSDAEAGTKYAAWVAAASNSPYCVGVAYFMQHDEPCLGQGPGDGSAALHQGEACAWGLIDCTDTPKWDLVTCVREANLQANAIRLAAMNGSAAAAARSRQAKGLDVSVTAEPNSLALPTGVPLALPLPCGPTGLFLIVGTLVTSRRLAIFS